MSRPPTDLSFACLLVALAAPVCMSQQQAAPDEIVCPRAPRPPVIDGLGDDACWPDAPLVDAFTRPLSQRAPEKAVSARVCFDADALYLLFTCREPEPERLKAGAADGGGDVWRDDCVEVWLNTSTGQLNLDQFICNAAGARDTVRTRLSTGPRSTPPMWPAKARVGEQQWTAELAIPFSVLQVDSPAAGDMYQIKLGREDYASGAQALSTWPAGSAYGGTEGYGRVYFERSNLLRNPQMARTQDGTVADWGFGEQDRDLFSSMQEAGRQVIRFDAPGRYAVTQQNLGLKPNSLYRLDAKVKGTAGVYLRARTSQKRGEPSTAYTVDSRPSADYQTFELRFPTGESGSALIIIGNTQGHGAGEVLIADLRVRQGVQYDADGPAVPLGPGAVTRVTKLPVADCRALRGFVSAPVDGRLDSYDWNMNVWEYGMRGAGAGVGYRYRNNDGLHITLADAEGVDAVQIRQGARVRMYADAERYDEPGEAQLVWDFPGRAKSSRALFPERVRSTRFSFFDLQDGRIANVSFLRVDTFAEWLTAGTMRRLGISPSGESGELGEQIARRFSEADPIHGLSDGAPGSVDMPAKTTVHLVSGPLADEIAVGQIGLEADLSGVPTGCPLTVAVQDPLNPRQELMGVDFALRQPGPVNLVMDFPDQIIPAGKRLWLSLTFGAPVTIGDGVVALYTVPRAEALPQALAFRKLVMKGLHCQLSEARQWNTVGKNTDLEKFYRENRWGPGVKDLAQTIAECKWLGPDDTMVRCYDEWVWRRARDLAPFEPVIDQPDGAPQWAVLARQAWLAAREVPRWWLDNRLVPTGEFGGLVGDDTDMYQNYADFPMLESDGVGARIMQAAALLAELAEEENLQAGLNKRTMDPLHAYEEGVNHEALMLWWFYGDPIYFERCLGAARSMPALTTVTELGHRHFKNQDCGAEDLRIERELGVDGHAHPLMLHPCFEVAWYNNSPKALSFLKEWADGWLEHMKPGEYATSVDVKTETVAAKRSRPLDGGYGGQGSAHNFLYWLTGQTRYIEPFMDLFRQGRDDWPARKYVPELWQRGALDEIDRREAVLRGNAITNAVALRDTTALCDALRNDIAEMQRFGMMYTYAEVFTDRVFLNAISNAAQCYTGGYATRNKYNHTHAVSWEGLGTDFAALVLTARPDKFKVLVYNFREEPLEGRMRLWTLDHGMYDLTTGVDSDSDDMADAVGRTQRLEVARATRVPIVLAPGAITVLQLTQEEKLDDIRSRPDLAVAAREMTVDHGMLTGIVHNIGGDSAPGYTLSLVDAAGKVVVSKAMPALAAPVDLEPKRAPFLFEGLPEDLTGWGVRVDPGDEIAEIFEGNNAADL